MKINIPILFMLIIASCYSPRMYHSKLRSNWPVKSGYLDGCFVGNGRIHLKNDSSILGLIGVFYLRYSADNPPDSLTSTIQILPVGKTKREDIQNVYLRDISNIKIQDTKSSDSAEFKPFDGAFAILIGKKNDFGLYRSYWFTKWTNDNESYSQDGSVITLVSNNKTLDSFNYPDYIKFINKRYGQHFPRQDFITKGEKAMIDYILEQESSKETELEKVQNKL